MLVLSRKETEKIIIGDDIVVTVSRICGNRVQLAISAPQDLRILRSEVKPFDSDLPAPTGVDLIATTKTFE